ncbi:MAG: polysaccharide pyruvyl transferase CsaB [Clostridia bacterium]|nr:polysaccharide pyruvyl transferase CsaB [Clostridia bacterium]
MKVLMVTMGMDIGGAETHILELCRAFVRRGISVSVASSGGVYMKQLEKLGIPHITLPLAQKTPTALLKARRGLEKLFQKEHFDIVHAHARIPAFLCGKLHKKYGFRFVTTDHLDFRLTPLLKKLTDWGEFTFAVSEDLRGYLLKNFSLNPDHIALTVNGIDTEHFAPRACNEALRETFYAQDRAVVLHISRLEENLCLCVRALMGAVEKLNGRIRLVVLGDGSFAPKLKEEAALLKEKLGFDGVLFAGATTDVESYIAASDIVVSPSRAAMEAMACAKPTIVCGSQGFGGIFGEEIIEEAIRSNFCFRGSPLPTADMLAKEIDRILCMSREEKEKLGNFGRAFIQSRYSVDVMAQTQLDGYQKILQYRTQEPSDILICGYYGYGNMGDETLLSVIVRELRRREPSVRICAFSATPEKTKNYHLIDAISRFDFIGIVEKMKHAKILLFGGGNLLQDKTSTHSLLYYTHILRMAKKYGLKILVYANGIGPIVSEHNKMRVKEALALADSISLRDRDSFLLVKSFDPERKIRLTFDPAILTESSGRACPYENYFVIAPKKTFPDCTEKLIALVRRLSEKTGLHPVVVSMYDDQDLFYARKIARYSEAAFCKLNGAEDCISLLESASLLISSRLHGLVYATAAACPMLGYSDDGKLFSYLDYIGFGLEDSVPCGVFVGESVDFVTERALKILSVSELCRADMKKQLSERKTMARREISEILKLLQS